MKLMNDLHHGICKGISYFLLGILFTLEIKEVMVKIIFAIIAVAFAVWAMVDVANAKLEKHRKVVWFIAVILIPIIGPMIYYFNKNRA